jgi:hypothetical protein
MRGRVVICGAIAQYNDAEQPPGPKNYLSLLINRGRMEGFIILDYLPRAGEAVADLSKWIAEGKIQDRAYLHDLATKDYEKIAAFKADTLILGCTDFTCVRDIIDEVVGTQAVVVDPAEEVVREATRVMTERGGLNAAGRKATTKFFITGDDRENFSTFGAKFLGVPEIDVTRVPLAEVQKAAGINR